LTKTKKHAKLRVFYLYKYYGWGGGIVESVILNRKITFLQTSWRDIAPLFRLFVLAKASFSRTALRFTEPRDVLLWQNRGFKSQPKTKKLANQAASAKLVPSV